MARIDDVNQDAQRIAQRKATNEYDPQVNQAPMGQARSYAERARERLRAKSIKGKAPPLGHVPPPDSDKMRAIAQMHGVPVEQEAPKQDPQGPVQMRGVGAAYAANQAQATAERPLSMKEAWERGMAAQPAVSEGSKEALRKVHEMADAKEETKPEKEPEQEQEQEESTSDAVDRAAEEALSAREIFGPDLFGVNEARQKLISKKRREMIEARLAPLDLSDLVMKGEMTQTVPVIPGKLSLTFRTLSQMENMWIMKYLYDFPGSPLYLQELNATCRLTCALLAVNDTVLPDHRSNIGESGEDIKRDDFERKLKIVTSYPLQLIADMSVQHVWFQSRVDRLFTLDELKNG